MKRFVLTVILLSMVLSTDVAYAIGRKHHKAFNDHGLVACKIVEVIDTPEWIAPLIVVVYDCVNDKMEFFRFLTVDTVYNTVEVDRNLAAIAAVFADPSSDFFATIGRIHFFKSIHPAEPWR